MKHPPYHLRMNKAVDRFILVELIKRLSNLRDIFEFKNVKYCSLGGPFLEDLKLIYEFFPEMELASVEIDNHTYRRQLLHQFTSKIHIYPIPLSEYLTREQPRDKEIFWLDYEELNENNLNEFSRVLDRVYDGSIVKITIPCDLKDTPFAGSEINNDDATPTKEQLDYVENFKNKFNDFLSFSINHMSFLRRNKFLDLVQSMVQVQTQRSLSAVKSELRFQILSSSFYNDGTTMLSIAGVVIKKEEIDRIKTHFTNWRFKNLDWSPPKEINVPVLSLKERLKLEKHLPICDSTDINLSKILNYNIANGEEESEKVLKQYAEFCKYYPVFAKITS